MKNLLKLLLILVLTLSLNSCGVHWQINSVGHTSQVDQELQVEEINTLSQLRWKFQRDWDFANNYYAFLQQQNYSFFQNMYWQNRMYRFGWNSPHSYWMNWQSGWNTGYSYNQYPYYGNWNSNSWYHNQWNGWSSGYGYNGWHQIYGPRTQWLGNVYGRRSSNRSPLFNSNSSRSSLLLDSKVSTSDSRTYIKNNTASLIENIIIRNNNKPRIVRNKPVINSKPVVVVKPIKNKPWYNNTNNNKPIWNSNSSSRPILNNSKPSYNSNRSNSKPIRSSIPKTTTNSSRKGPGRK